MIKRISHDFGLDLIFIQQIVNCLSPRLEPWRAGGGGGVKCYTTHMRLSYYVLYQY